MREAERLGSDAFSILAQSPSSCKESFLLISDSFLYVFFDFFRGTLSRISEMGLRDVASPSDRGKPFGIWMMEALIFVIGVAS